MPHWHLFHHSAKLHASKTIGMITTPANPPSGGRPAIYLSQTPPRRIAASLITSSVLLTLLTTLVFYRTFTTLLASSHLRPSSSPLSPCSSASLFHTTLPKFRNTTTILRPLGNNPTILTPDFPSIKSPNGIYKLELEHGGNLVLKEKGILGGWNSVWWSSTGSSCSLLSCGAREWNHTIALDTSGRLAVMAVKKGASIRLWHSFLLKRCARNVPEDFDWEAFEHGRGLGDDDGEQRLELSDAGKLAVRDRRGDEVCVIREEGLESLGDGRDGLNGQQGNEQNASQKPRGRLAVVVSGLYRSNARTCRTHVEQLSVAWPGSIDVFVFTYAEKEMQNEIETAIRECYGSLLKGVQIVTLGEVAEGFPGELAQQCGGKLHRLNAQLKTVMLGGRVLERYMLKTGETYEGVLRLRMDMWLGEMGVRFEDIWETGKLMLPHPAGEHYFYCGGYEGSLNVGPTDQIAYGSVASMTVYMDLYHHFGPLITSGAIGSAFRSYDGCEGLPYRPEPEWCAAKRTCWIECIVGYYLALKGVPWEIQWDWEQGILR